MPQMKGGKALVASVLQHGVDTIFGLPGGQIYEVFDALYDEPDVQIITTRNEGGAGYMAFGYARSSGRGRRFLRRAGTWLSQCHDGAEHGLCL